MPSRKKTFNVHYKPTEFDIRVHEYFEKTPPDKYTRAGLLLYLKIGDQKFRNMAKRKEFKDTCDYAMAKFQNMYEERLATSSKTTGAIFALKQLGWSDKQNIGVAMETGLTIEQVVKGKKMKA